jgi:formamidopyrimidine-DNA glycosylase
VPELPEVEVLVRHLDPLIRNKTIREVQVRREKVIRPGSVRAFAEALEGGTFTGVSRRGKYLLFTLRAPQRSHPLRLLGHLGMTGRMYLLPAKAPLPKHAAVVMGLGHTTFVFEDTRYFGRLTLDCRPIERLGPEPLGPEFTSADFLEGLQRSRQPIKVRLLDQALVAGIGNIYASEALFRARLAPTLRAREVTRTQAARLWRAIRAVLREAIRGGATVPLNYAGTGKRDGLFYFGRAHGAPDYYEERLRVYDRAGRPCITCGTGIRRRVQAARSTYYCPQCQGRRR